MLKPHSGARAALARNVIEWLEAERAVLEKSWVDSGISPTVTINRRILRRKYESIGERSAVWSFKFESKATELQRFQTLSPIASPLFAFSTRAPTDAMVAAYGEFALIEAIVEHGVDDPTKRMAFFLARLCGDYLRSLDKISVGNEQSAS